MRKAFLGTVAGAMLFAISASIAFAAFIQWPGGRCEGTMDSDQIDGSEVRDFIFAKVGDDDDVEGGDSNDVIYGREGDDQKGGFGFDQVQLGEVEGSVGEAGNDEIFGNEGSDDIEGGTGNDNIYGNEEEETSSSGPSSARATASSVRGATTSWTLATRMASTGSTAAKATIRTTSTPATGWQPTARPQPK